MRAILDQDQKINKKKIEKNKQTQRDNKETKATETRCQKGGFVCLTFAKT